MQRWLETNSYNCSKQGSTIPLTERAQFILVVMTNTPLLLNYRIYGHIGKFVTVLIIILTIVLIDLVVYFRKTRTISRTVRV